MRARSDAQAAARSSEIDRALAETTVIGDARERLRSRLAGRELLVTLLIAVGFVIAATACALLLPSDRAVSPLVVVGYVLVYAVVSRVEFEVGPGAAVPTVLVLVPMLFVLPPGLAPTCVALGLVCGGLLDRIRKGLRIERLTVLLCSSWHSVGPAVVIALYAPGPPSWHSIGVYVVALGAQFALDGAATALRQCVGRGVTLISLARPLALVWLVDCTLAPIALAIAAVATSEPVVVVCVLPLVGLLHVLAGERKRYIDDNVVLGEAVESASRAAMSDPLTGVGNRRAWSDAVARQGTTAPVSVLLVDLNGLKETNDTHGHDVGDRVIQALATALVRALPKATVVARIGGDEFAVLLEQTGHDQAVIAAAGVRREVARATVAGVQVSASIGHASSPPCSSVDVALLRADEELYRAKALHGHVRSRTGSGVRLQARP